MALPESGKIELAEVNIELGNPSNAQIDMNNTAVRDLFGIGNGQIGLANGHGKSAYTPEWVVKHSGSNLNFITGTGTTYHGLHIVGGGAVATNNNAVPIRFHIWAVNGFIAGPPPQEFLKDRTVELAAGASINLHDGDTTPPGSWTNVGVDLIEHYE